MEGSCPIRITLSARKCQSKNMTKRNSSQLYWFLVQGLRVACPYEMQDLINSGFPAESHLHKCSSRSWGPVFEKFILIFHRMWRVKSYRMVADILIVTTTASKQSASPPFRLFSGHHQTLDFRAFWASPSRRPTLALPTLLLPPSISPLWVIGH